MVAESNTVLFLVYHEDTAEYNYAKMNNINLAVSKEEVEELVSF